MIDRAAYDEHMGFEIVAMDDEGATLTAVVGQHLHNPAGVVHGGVLAGLMDSSMGLWLMNTLDDDHFATNVDLHTRFLAPVRDGEIAARSRVVRRGKRTVVMEADLVQDEVLVATCSSTFMVLEKRG